GLAALLLERHPDWKVEQVKSALELTGDPVRAAASSREVPPTFEGGGRVNGVRANTPLLLTNPTGVSFGFLSPGGAVTRTVALSDAGGGAGRWAVSVQFRSGRARVAVPTSTQVPGRLRLTARGPMVGSDVAGFVVLKRGAA